MLLNWMVSNCPEMSVFDTYRKSWYSMDSQQTYMCDHKMDQSLWQTSSTFGLLYSFHEWIQLILSCEKYSSKIQIMTVSRFWHCRGSGRFEIDFRWIIVRIRKSHVCSSKLDVQETDMCVPQFIGIWNFSLKTGLRTDGIPVLDPRGLDITLMHSISNQEQKDK